jgi:hypothetical protein
MTPLLEQAVAELQKLPDPAQDAMAAWILEQIAANLAWDESFARSQDQLTRGSVAASESSGPDGSGEGPGRSGTSG